MNNLKDRIQTHSTISKKLAAISDDELSVLLATGEVFHSGWGKSLLLNIDGTKIFVKKIPVTNLELLPENIMSTANLFDLPTYYQYGVGSAGFGIWRELAAHITTTNWVISGECKNFPIMYHWRTMVGSPNILNIDHWGSFENYYKYWENSNAIRKRVEALNTASSHILLFLEYVPHNLYQWLNDQFSEGVSSAESAIIFIDNNLKTINHFINSHGLLHFDAHFENILTDGKLIYFSDFGLALSTKFDLSAKEIEFFNYHRSYDQSSTIVNLVNCIVANLFEEKSKWPTPLSKYIDYKSGINNFLGVNSKLTPVIADIINKYAPIALVMDEFYQKLKKESKFTVYPAEYLEKVLQSYEH